MHDFSFFLLKNWLPVGASAILFFGIGLLLAKAIWGRFNQRLANAIEENLNLASQWNALGASQQDLFKKLRVRWQSDRDAYETALAERDHRIAQLGSQLQATGTAIPSPVEIPAEELSSKAKVRELEAALAAERAETAKLRDELDKMAELPVLPFAVKGTAESEPEADALQTRVRDLEQDLIDTHDELHKVRSDYEKQVKLVESLEAKLIAVPVPAESPLVEAGPSPKDEAEQAQLQALLVQRARELRQTRDDRGLLRAEALHLRGEAEATEAALRNKAEAKEAALREEARLAEATAIEAKEALEARITGLSADLEAREGEIARLEELLGKRDAELEEARTGLDELETLRRRRSAVQAELNDVHHELYDVRRALNRRIEGIGLLEGRLAELSSTEEKNAALSAQLHDARRDLSDLRIALAAKAEDYQKALAQMEELEAIISDRGAEVNDLSAELRQQRDQARLLREKLAATEGELEALSEESHLLSAGIEARAHFVQERQDRIAILEATLGERYRELNQARADAEAYSRKARHYESHATHLEDELARRAVEHTAFGREAAAAGEALETANATIVGLTRRLEQSEVSLAGLREELERVSRDKDETLHELDRATQRVAELEEAAQRRESQLAGIEGELAGVRQIAEELEEKAATLQAELDRAAEERRLSATAAAELKEAIRQRESQLAGIENELVEARQVAEELERKADTLQTGLDRAGEERRLSAAAAAKLEETVRQRESQLTKIENELAEARQVAGELEEKAAALHAELDRAAEERRLSASAAAGLEETVRQRESQLAGIEGELAEARQSAGELERKAIRLQTELDRAVEERRLSASAVAELEEALHGSDERTLGLSTHLDQKEVEVSALLVEVTDLRALAEERSTSGAETLAQETAWRDKEIEALRTKLAARAEEIRDLQNRVSEVVMQRTSQAGEIASLKDRLAALEAGPAVVSPSLNEILPAVPEHSHPGGANGGAPSYETLAAVPEEEGTPLDELPGQGSHHKPKETSPPAAPPAPEPVAKRSGLDEEFTVFFSESTASPARSETEKIDRVARSVRGLGRKVEVTVVGYAGAEGTPDFSEALSARRADAVRARLVERGVPLGAVKVRAAGQDRRFSDGKARRVEMILSPVAVAETVN